MLTAQILQVNWHIEGRSCIQTVREHVQTYRLCMLFSILAGGQQALSAYK
jgi:hypothetical protein